MRTRSLIAWALGKRRCGVAAGAACALACLTLATGAQAALIPVDIEGDIVAADGHCSLREAITTANDDVPPFPGAGECAAGAVSDVVTVPAGHFVLSRTGPPDDTNVNGDLDVLGAGLTIRGQGAGSTTIDANRIDRVLDVLTGRVATLEGLTLTGGQAPNGANGGNVTGAPGTFAAGGNGGPGESGGGIRNAGTLTIADSAVSNNFAGDGGDGGFGHGGDGTTAATGTNGANGVGGSAVIFNSGYGGGIYTSGTLTLTRVTVSDNRAGDGGRGGLGIGGQGGGGISGNGGNGGGGTGGSGGGGGWGGGIAATTGATLTIDLSTISGNSAGDGGDGGNGQGGLGGVTSGNGSVGGTGGFGGGGGGGVFDGRGGSGGGIYSVEPIKITRSLVAGNRAGAGGLGGNGTGALGGHAIDVGGNAATGGHGGPGSGEDGGDAGLAGGVFAQGEYVNVTIQGNDIGDGGTGGDGKGGKGGNSTGGPTGGAGGIATPGDGGSGGVGGGLILSGSASFNSTIRHATVTANGVGAGGAFGSATGGSGGTPGGSAGGVGIGFAGFSGGVGGIIGGSSTLLADSVVAGNANDDCSSGTSDGGHNFTFPTDTCPGTVADPQLAPLADNGGPTRTQALLPGSPLIDAVPAGPECAGTDQRGIVRPQGPACDAGAYEVEVEIPTPPGGGSPADTERPVFLAASLKPATFAVNRHGAPETAVASRAREGTTFRFRLSEAARVVFAIQRARPGRRAKGHCVKPEHSNRHKPKCTRFVGTDRFAVTAGAGDNAKKFSGRIGRHALKPGRYRATLTATDAAGNESAPKRLNFRVVRPVATN
ncbi:MAG TPA: choice-of-anchor Q domain-containing protein [Solirubrobacterales bacterium]